MQNKIIRFILKLEPRSHIGRVEFEKLGMLKVEDRIKQLKLNHVFKIYHDEAPEYLISHFRKFSNIVFTDTQLEAVLQILFYQKLRVKRAIHFSLMVLRNGILTKSCQNIKNPCAIQKGCQKPLFISVLIYFMQLFHQKVQYFLSVVVVLFLFVCLFVCFLCIYDVIFTYNYYFKEPQWK